MPEGSLSAVRSRDDAASTQAASAPSPRRRRWLPPALMLAGVLALAVGGGWYWLQGGRYATTDDAYVQADKLLVSTDVSGIVQDIAVHEGQ
jgi:membrane fusion protein, multidrug efflux system